MDSLIHVLLRYSRDKAFDRILMMEKGKTTKRCSDIVKRHNKSLELSVELVVFVDNKWQVKSATKPVTYTVEKSNPCEGNCWIRCQLCGICVHDYTCTCPDSLLHGTICKHIHLVIRSLSQFHKQPLQPITNKYQREAHTPRTRSYANLFLSVQKKKDCKNIKDRLLLKLSNINAEVTTAESDELLLAIEKHLKSCINSLQI